MDSIPTVEQAAERYAQERLYVANSRRKMEAAREAFEVARDDLDTARRRALEAEESLLRVAGAGSPDLSIPCFDSVQA